MTPEQLLEIQDTIKKTVNGKIDLLTFKLESYIVADNEWKKKAQPTIDMGNNMRGFGKVSLYVIGFLTSVTILFTGCAEFIKKIK